MDDFDIGFFLSIISSVITYYIYKWIDKNGRKPKTLAKL